MPELPEAEAIVGVMARHSIGQTIVHTEVLREPLGRPYFGIAGMRPTGRRILRIHRRGKRAIMLLDGGALLDCHNAMTGYWDYEDDPWTFDYVEGPRSPGRHVRLRLELSNGRVLRFNDARMFGSVRMLPDDMASPVGPELMRTPHGDPDAPVMGPEGFARWMLSDPRPVKEALMDQHELAGIGNIYSVEACHLAGVDPRRPADRVGHDLIPVLHEALRCAVLHCIPQVTYSWLRVYRRSLCGSCGGPVTRAIIGGRSTFLCERCQTC